MDEKEFLDRKLESKEIKIEFRCAFDTDDDGDCQFCFRNPNGCFNAVDPDFEEPPKTTL